MKSLNPWILLFIISGLEIVFYSCLRLSNEFSNIPYVIGAVASALLIYYMLTITMLKMSPSVVFAAWGGLGVIAVTIGNYFIFNDKLNATQLVCIALIAAANVGLNLSTKNF